MPNEKFLVYLLVMAGVTYLVRMIPMVAVRKKSRINTYTHFYIISPTPF